MRRLVVLASGNGSNLQAIMDACESGLLSDAQVAAVASDHRAAYALERARRHGVPAHYHAFAPYRQRFGSQQERQAREAYDADLAALLTPYQPDLVVMAGWMRLLSMAFLRHYPGRVINLHPALPGAFPGIHAIERALAAYREGKIEHTGVMVHYVPDEAVDDGPVILQQVVPILPEDTLATLEERIHAVEHALYVQAIANALANSRPG
jgi:formyltetrahydrofolate-dependent phosphoribosylglycinamide formyltransferase